MGDARLVEDRAAADEAGPFVEGCSAELRMQHGLAIAARAGRVEQGIEHGAADATMAKRRRHGHAADLGDAGNVLEQPSGAQGAAEPVEGDRMDSVGIGVVPLHGGRDPLLADEDLGADRPGDGFERVPRADAHLDHRLPCLELLEHRTQFRRHGFCDLGDRVGEDVDQLAAHQKLVLAEGAPRERDRRFADAGAPDADVEHLVVARRAEVLERRLAHEEVAGERRHRLGVRQREGAPVAGDGRVEVGEVVAVEDDLLGIDLGPAHAQALEESEVGTWHGARCVAAGSVPDWGMALINYITQVQLDFGALSLLAQELDRAGIVKPLLVTDAGVRAAGLLDRAIAAIGARPHAVFDATPSNPTERAVRAAAERYIAEGCDGLVAIGGGSSIDLAKGVAIAATHPGPLSTYATIEGGSAKISERVAPLIAVPTTAGTGSEVARGAIVIVDDGRKLGFHSWHLVPKAALCDPELTLGLPPFLTAATGMDAIAHCMETFMAPAVNPPADGIALDGLERAWSHIERATRDGSDREARFNMMSASMQGAMAFQKGLGCVHSLSHSLGGANPKLHHGTLNAMFLPAVVRFNASTPSIVKERRLERMAHAMGLHGAEHDGHTADAVAQAIVDLNKRLGLPSGLAEMGVDRSMYERIIDGAMADHTHKTNPRLATRQDYERMLDDSM